MTPVAVALLVVAAVAAVTNWVAVATRTKPLEYAAKPLTTVALVGVAVAIEPRDTGARVLFVIALVLSLAGDVLLMLPNRKRFFAFGLASFLVAHVAYIPGLVMLGADPAGLGAGLFVVVIALGTFGQLVVNGVRHNQPALTVPVIVYAGVLGAMVVAAWGTLLPLAVAGALLFLASDAILAGNEFVRPKRFAPVVVMVTYHLAQALLVLSLVAG